MAVFDTWARWKAGLLTCGANELENQFAGMQRDAAAHLIRASLVVVTGLIKEQQPI